MIDLSTLYEPPTDEAYQTLKEDIALNGLDNNIIVDETGQIIDGHTRKRICEELGIYVRETIKPGLSDDEKLAMAIARNARRRSVSQAARNSAIETLVRIGWSNRRIAENVGTDDKTVAAVISTAEFPQSRSTKATSQDGRKRPTSPATPEEAIRRLALIEKLYSEGHSTLEIGRALDMSDTTVQRALKAAGIERSGKKGKGIPSGDLRWRNSELAPSLSSVPPLPKPPPDYRKWQTLRPLELFVADFRDKDYANVFAWRVQEGIEDAAWIREQRELLETLADQVNRLLMIVRDPEYRKACQETLEGRENMRNPTLRIVEQ